MERDEILRTFGILPERIQPVRGVIRSRLTTANIVGQWIAFLMFGLGPFLLGLLLLAVVPILEVRLGVGGFLCVLGLILGFLIARDVNEWVELDGSAFRWKHLFTWQVNERAVSELESIETLTLAFKTHGTEIIEAMYGRIKGFEFRFPHMKQGVRIFRTDPTMTNVRELVEAVVARMYQYGDVVPDMENFEGTPLVRRLTLRRK